MLGHFHWFWHGPLINVNVCFIVIEIEDGSEPELPDLHLIVTSALEPSIVYQ